MDFGRYAFQDIMKHLEDGLIRTKLSGALVCSWYASPRATLAEDEQMFWFSMREDVGQKSRTILTMITEESAWRSRTNRFR